MIIFFICDSLQDGSHHELGCCLPPLEFHPLQWVKSPFVAFATSIRVSNLVAPVVWLMYATFCRLCLVRALFDYCSRHQDVSVSRRVVFAEWFVIIRRPPLGNAPGPLCEFMLLHPPKNTFFQCYERLWTHTWRKKVKVKYKRLTKTCKHEESTCLCTVYL